MKKLFTFIAVAFLIGAYSVSAQTFSVQKAENPTSFTEKEEWMHWDDGVNANSIGTDAAFVFAIASRWEPADLTEYDGMQITKITFFPRVADATYTLKVWTGADADEAYTQDIPSITNQAWNEIELATPFTIDGSDELWFGVHIDTPGGYPAGCDEGPAVGSKGNMIYSTADGWNPLTDLNAALDYNWNLQAFVVEAGAQDEYPVTFNVDMAGAVADNEVAFDPEIHRVFISGSFTDPVWNEPGTNDDLELFPVASAKQTTTFTEDWEGFADFTTDLSPWTTIDVHGATTYGIQDHTYPGSGEPSAWKIMNPAGVEPSIAGTSPAHSGSKYAFSVAQTTVPATGEENKWLISPQMTVTDASVLTFYARSYTHQYGAERMKVYISTDGVDIADFTQISDGDYIEVPEEWTDYSYPLADYAGQAIHFAIENVSNDAFMLFLDSFEVTNLFVEEEDELVYTITMDLPEGEYDYKYFFIEDEPSWEMGEWPGSGDRTISITGPATFDDVWGVRETSVDEVVAENGMVVYPNPALSSVKVASANMINEIRIFDIAGRLVFSSPISGFNAEINVMNFNRGMYFMQIFGEKGVETHKIQVIK